MLNKNALQTAREFILAEKGEISPLPLSEEELNPTVQDDLSFRAVALESTASCYTVNYKHPQDSLCSEFSFFEDGRQRTVQIGLIPVEVGSHQIILPVHFFVVAAVILQRVDKELKVWSQPAMKTGILVDKHSVPDQSVLEEFEKAGLTVVHTAGLGGDYYDLKRRALQEAKNLRLEVENEVIGRWRRSTEAKDKYLVIDGTLMNLRDEENVERCVGVSKSFGSRYFDISDQNRIMRMREFERSWSFRFHAEEDDQDSTRLGGRERVSWYLRLRSRPNTDPEFGLVRVEISQRHIKSAPELAERFSRSILSERLPTSYPAPRWHNHLYPIAACESYLSSIMPSVATINACMKG